MKIGDRIIGIVILLLIIISVVIWLPVITDEFNNTEEKWITIKVDGIVDKAFSIDDTTERTYEFNFDEHEGQVEVRNGAVRMLEMTRDICPKKICSDTGWISKNYEIIVCLPNKIIVEIKSNSIDEEELDFIVSYKDSIDFLLN